MTFTPDGNSLISPVGNRVTVFNLASSTSVTLPFEHVKGALSALSASASEKVTRVSQGGAPAVPSVPG